MNGSATTTKKATGRLVAFGASAALMGGGLFAMVAPTTASAANCQVTQSPAGGKAVCDPGQRTFTVPQGITSLSVTARGGAGGAGGTRGTSKGGSGGQGAVVVGNIAVTGGQVLTVYAGAKGATTAKTDGSPTGGAGGNKDCSFSSPTVAGAGGGASSVSLGTKSLLVAGGGGGGGGGGWTDGHPGGDGGDAGSTPGSGKSGTSGAAGGAAAKTSGPGENGAKGNSSGYFFSCKGSGPGGGGGGGLAGGKGGLAGSGVDNGGGGGGAGSSGADASLTSGVVVKSGNTSAGSIVIEWAYNNTITTLALPDANFGKPYSEQLTTANNKGAVTWSLVSGALPSGLTLSPGGLISGTPDNPKIGYNTSTFRVRAVDSQGFADERDLDLTEITGLTPSGQPGAGLVGSAPATDITENSAVGHGTVWPRGASTQVWCQIAETEGAVDAAPRVPANPSRVAGNVESQEFTCNFTGLETDQPYFFRTYGEDAQGQDNSGPPQEFITDGLLQQTAKLDIPGSLAASGSTVVLPGTVKTSLGRNVSVTMQRLGKTKQRAAKLVHDNATGEFKVVTDGEYYKVRLIWFASGSDKYAPLEIEKVYKNKGSAKKHSAGPAPTLKRSDLGKGSWRKVKNSNAECTDPIGGASVQYETKGRQQLVHEDAYAFDTKKHAKQGYRLLSKCVTESGEKRVGARKVGTESRTWGINLAGGDQRSTVMRKGKDVALVVIAKQVDRSSPGPLKNSYVTKVNTKAAKRLK